MQSFAEKVVDLLEILNVSEASERESGTSFLFHESVLQVAASYRAVDES